MFMFSIEFISEVKKKKKGHQVKYHFLTKHLKIIAEKSNLSFSKKSVYKFQKKLFCLFLRLCSLNSLTYWLIKAK